ncbi:hypothetical protein SAMN04489732_107172 [Amycolatopsis saalfeldensis]|uniref:Uncharacterized protein n=1 Tax=Amycolatopsis saalfeldensis TaxID=394193 RepID=A0A1H8XFJ3_9PSEU|nr:hypothetical protein SAMN04489732_107172 [Amycolatopsis saalfeldensis]
MVFPRSPGKVITIFAIWPAKPKAKETAGVSRPRSRQGGHNGLPLVEFAAEFFVLEL